MVRIESDFLRPSEIKNKLKNGLYVVSTPIGNLRDISLRAIDVLKKSHLDMILFQEEKKDKQLITII